MSVNVSKCPKNINLTNIVLLAKNPTNHDRSKHIDVQHHFIREKIENKVVELKYCPM